MKYFYFFTGLLFPFCLIGQDTTAITLADMTVTANIIESEIQRTARHLTVIEKKTIENAPVKTLDGILQYALNVDVRSRGPLGVQADISIRGGHYDQTLILLDGVKVNDPQTGHHSLNLPISLSQIERIEVLQGGASRVFGPSAFSGVINIISKKIVSKGLGFQVLYGQHNLQSGGATAQWVKKSFYMSAQAEGMKSDGFALNTAFQRKSMGIKMGRDYKNGNLDFSVAKLKNAFEAANFYHPKFNNQYEEVATFLTTLDWTQNFSNRILGVFRANYRKHQDVYDFDNYRNTNKLASVNFHATNVWAAEWKFRVLNAWGGQTAFGLEYRHEGVLSNRLGETRSQPIEIMDFPGLFYTKSKERENGSGFFEHQKKINRFTVVGGALVNYNSQFGMAIYPGIDISMKASKGFNLFGSINRALRYPTFTELYLNTSTVVAEPNLLPEKAWTFDIGVKQNTEIWQATYGLFLKKTTDAIDKIKRPNKAIPTMENIDNINMMGVEVSQKISIVKLLKIKWLKNVQWNYAYLLANRREDGYQSFYTLNYLRHKFSVGAEMQATKHLSISSWFTYKYREGTYQWDASTPAVSYKPIQLCDTRLAYTNGKFRFFVDANNIFSTKYFEHGFVQQPGRWVSTGFNAHF
jgi:vitamin B12 transporter